MQSKGTILIVDDDPTLLHSHERLLRLHGYSVKTFMSAASLLNYNLPSGECCAIVDVQMPGRSGGELQSLLARIRPGMPVILITGYGDIPQAVQAMRAGAADFLTKPIEEKRLLKAVKRAFEQEQHLRLEQQERLSHRARFDSLTAREREVCLLVVEGKLNKQIAAILGTCEKTVKVHRGRVMKKMKVESLAELVRVVVKLDTVGTTPQAAPPIASKQLLLVSEDRDHRPAPRREQPQSMGLSSTLSRAGRSPKL